MKKTIGLLSLFSLVILAGCNPSTTQTPSQTKVTDATQSTQETTTKLPESTQYKTYTEQAVNAALQAGDEVVLFVYNSGCGSCKLLDQNINANQAKLPGSTKVFKIDYQSQKDVMKKYNVDSYHTLIYLDGQGNEINRTKGSAFTVQDILDGMK